MDKITRKKDILTLDNGSKVQCHSLESAKLIAKKLNLYILCNGNLNQRYIDYILRKYNQ
jgi:hypothetical protein